MLNALYLLIASSGFAALSWEVIWQLKATLALGISAWGSALTIAVMMGGMGLGAFCMGRALRQRTAINVLRIYGSLEILIGLCGLLLIPAFHILEKFDSWVYSVFANGTPLVYILGITLIFSLPTLCIGATLPLFKIMAEQRQLSLSKLYALNTLGAALSVLGIAFFLIPNYGVMHTAWIISAVNIIIGCVALSLHANNIVHSDVFEVPYSLREYVVVFITGFTIFTLEIAWFRSFSNVFPNTTDVFAIILAAVLIALALGAKNATQLRKRKKLLGTQLCLAGVLILLVTPIIERIDFIFSYLKQLADANKEMIAMHVNAPLNIDWLFTTDMFTLNWLAIGLYAIEIGLKFACICLMVIPPLRLLGVVFPWLLDKHGSPQHVGKLYAVNTLAAILGSLATAWILLPTIGMTKTAWLAGTLVVVTGVILLQGFKRISGSIIGISALCTAIYFQTGIGVTRAQGYFATDYQGHLAKVLAYYEGPQSTVAAVEYPNLTRALLINSSSAALESNSNDQSGAHYMAWMGHLPMLLHADPKHVLVICFGTGQTANAVRNENPETLDIVDVNPAVFKLANYFKSNENVLNDPRVKTTVMDGRTYLRRTNKKYDVITLEPMPPNTVGVNALYAKEFYQQAQKKLTADGIIAQWLPFHVVTPYYTASIVKTFIEVFPNAILWFDDQSKTGILLGTNNSAHSFGHNWPGYSRRIISRDLSLDNTQQRVVLNATGLKKYAAYGEVIKDDNQLLAYGKALYITGQPLMENLRLLRFINQK